MPKRTQWAGLKRDMQKDSGRRMVRQLSAQPLQVHCASSYGAQAGESLSTLDLTSLPLGRTKARMLSWSSPSRAIVLCASLGKGRD